MKIRQTNLNLVYPRLKDHRKKFTGSEEILHDHFLPSTILPVPDEVQEDVPRIIAETKTGHSVLNISLTVASFTTNYDNDFVSDWCKCREYLEQRCSEVYTIIENLTESDNIFVGLVTNIEIDDLDEPGLDVLKKSLLKKEASEIGDIFDLSCKLTYIYEKKYYINITLQNWREFSVEEYNGGRKLITAENKHSVVATLDINDRYAANSIKNYRSTKESFDKIIDITNNIIENKLEELLRKGEFCL